MSRPSPVCTVRGWDVLRWEEEVAFSCVREGASVEVSPDGVDVYMVPVATWRWLGPLLAPLVEWVARYQRLPSDDTLVHLVMRAAHQAGLTRDEVQDHRPDPRVTLDEEI